MNVLNKNIFKDCKREKSDEERKLWTVMKSYRMMKLVICFFLFFFFWATLFFNSASMLLNFFMNISIITARHFLYLLYFCPCLDLGLIMSYLCHLFFIFFIIFIMIDCIISWIQTHLFFCWFSKICPIIFGWRIWMNFHLAKVQPQGVA